MANAKPSLPLNRALFHNGERVCVAVSGGADSTALLLALHQQATELGIGITAAHLHHGIRGHEADEDTTFLQNLCQHHDIPFTVEHTDVPSAADRDDETLEEAARNARLSFFDRLLAAGHATAVATAHTEDDQAETVMMKLIRGAWTEGLGGISPVLERPSGRVIRPLLNANRTEVVAYLQARSQPWREDSTNASPAHTRNRVRATLMPLLRDFNPSITSTLAATASLAREEEARWQPEIARLLNQLALPGKPVRGGGRAVSTAPEDQSIAFEINRLKDLDIATRRRLLRSAAMRIGCRLNSTETAKLLQLSGLAPADQPVDPTVPSRPNTRLQLGSSVLAERSVRELRLSRVTKK